MTSYEMMLFAIALSEKLKKIEQLQEETSDILKIMLSNISSDLRSGYTIHPDEVSEK